eukprot:SAG31_NODE_26408_length_443_cov_0.566860_1_plen_25_part_10
MHSFRGQSSKLRPSSNGALCDEYEY